MQPGGEYRIYTYSKGGRLHFACAKVLITVLSLYSVYIVSVNIFCESDQIVVNCYNTVNTNRIDIYL